MNLLMVTGIALGLSMDALAVSVTNGCIVTDLKFRYALRIAFFFGLFQALMPVLGWIAGSSFRAYIQDFDHWVAFGLLLLVGGKMIREALSSTDAEDSKINCLHFPTLLLLSVATSIDALAVGISFAMLDMVILVPVSIIGVITFVNCLIGTQIGSRAGRFLEGKLEFVGGCILILIGIKIVIEHSVKNI